MDWNRTDVVELINHYREFECLWDNNSENYNNIDVKKNAWIEIANLCCKEVEEVKRKVKYLRTAYVSEKKKVVASKEHGVSYEPNLFYYKDLDFLDTVVVLRKSSLPPTVSSSSSFVRRTFPHKRKHKIITQYDRKSLRDSKFNSALDAIVASVSTPLVAENDNLFDSFGKTAALQLQQLPPDIATEAMSEIYNLVSRKTLDSIKKFKNK